MCAGDRVAENDGKKVRITGDAEYDADSPNVGKVRIIELEKYLGLGDV